MASDFGHTENFYILVRPTSTRHPFQPASEVHDIILLGQIGFRTQRVRRLDFCCHLQSLGRLGLPFKRHDFHSSASHSAPGTFFSIGQILVCRSTFLFVLFKSSNRVAEFFLRVRRNNFCAKLVVSTLSTTEDRFSFDRSRFCLPVSFTVFSRAPIWSASWRNDFCAKLCNYPIVFLSLLPDWE